MKRTPLLLAVLTPFAASAGAATSTESQTVNHQELRDDLQVTALLGADVQGADGQASGSVEDVILDRQGRVVSVIIQAEGDAGRAMDDAEQTAKDTLASAEGTAEEAWNDVTDERDRPTRDTVADESARGGEEAEADAGQREGMGLDPDRIGATEVGDAFTKVDWSGITVDEQAQVVRLSGAGGLQPVQYDQTEPLQSQDEIRASNLVGMEVNLVDEESFGEVEDVLIDMKDGKASAIVVDSMEFFDKERYALPVNLESVNFEEEELTVQFTQAQVDGMEEFELQESAMEDPGFEDRMEDAGDTDAGQDAGDDM